MKRFVILLLTLCICLTGCWDKDKLTGQILHPVEDSPAVATPAPAPQLPETAASVPATTVPAETGQEKAGSGVKAAKEVQGLVLINQLDESILCDLKYATTDNFTGKAVYSFKEGALRRQTAEKLVKASARLKEKGLRLKVWDAYRPLAVQKIFWELVKDERYVANPQKRGSNHNRGTAVDVTLVDQAGKELVMPSAFDDFSVKASRDNPDMPQEAAKNLALLTEVMTECGFRTINSEWWHYDDMDSGKYPLLDVNMAELLGGEGKKEIKQEGAAMEKKVPVEKKGILSGVELDGIKGLQDSRQVVLVAADSFASSSAQVIAYEKAEGQWKEVFSAVKAMTGRNGFANKKAEGDGKSPAGVFSLTTCYSRTENPGTKLKFVPFRENDFWVDDSKSKYYNTFQHGPSNGRWSSAEDLYRIGSIYKYFVAIEYNTQPVIPGRGSAIFLHIWEGDGIKTFGCTAMAEANLLRIIKWLDPAKKPRIIQGPISELGKM